MSSRDITEDIKQAVARLQRARARLAASGTEAIGDAIDEMVAALDAATAVMKRRD